MGPSLVFVVISFDEATRLVIEAAAPIGSESVPIASAVRRFLAARVVAQIDAPRVDCSAMDGYALRDENFPTRTLIGACYPGTPFDGTLIAQECVRIFTGAPIPAGADRVVIQEIVEDDGQCIRITGEVGRSRHVRRAGSDFRSGDCLLEPGRRLDARALMVAAGADFSTLEVGRSPRVTVLATGDELVEPGTARDFAQAIPESVSIGVAAMVEEQGGVCISRQRLPDDRAVLENAAANALEEADLVVMTGGASVGERDYAKAVFLDLGVNLIFSRIAIKPGKPAWFGRAGSTLVLGLPGNPASALVTARLLLSPLVRGLAGGDPDRALGWRRGVLSEDLPACGERETFVRGRTNGRTVGPISNQDSSAQHPLVLADVLIRRRAGAPPALAGDDVEIIDF